MTSLDTPQPQLDTPVSGVLIPTVYLHGFTGEGSSLLPFARAYSGDNALCINLPGFGGTAAPPKSQLEDVNAYADAVWQVIRHEVPTGPVRLVGHSHGTMVAYTLAVQHPDEVVELDLFCPVSYPRLVPRSLVYGTDILLRLGLPAQWLVKVMRRPWFVNLTTRYLYRPHWTADVRRRIKTMRLQEARYYSPAMLYLMRQTLKFRSVMDETRCSVPTRICYAADDNVASPHDHEWFAARTVVVEMQGVAGDHLCVVAEPEAIAKQFGRT